MVSGSGTLIPKVTTAWMQAAQELQLWRQLDPGCPASAVMPMLSVRVSGFGFRVSGFGFRVSGFGFRGIALASRTHDVQRTQTRAVLPRRCR